MMSELGQNKTKIAVRKAELATAKIKLAEAEGVGEDTKSAEFERLAPVVSSAGQTLLDPLTLFWSYIVSGKVYESEFESSGMENGDASTVNRVKVITFTGREDPTKTCAKWGPSFMFHVLVERQEYVRCWDLMRTRQFKYILLRGTEGIGKSVFIYWLIYKIIQAAKTTGSETSETNLPTILLITIGGADGKLYRLLSVVNDVPVVHRVTSDVHADYVLSDVVFDCAVYSKYWNMNVGASKDPDIFGDTVCDARESGLEMTMEPCSLEEIQAMAGHASAFTAAFSYIVFGGSARLASMLNCTTVTGGTMEVADVAWQELVRYFAGSVYADSSALIDQAALVIAKMVATAVLRGKHPAQHSLFLHTYLSESNTQGSGQGSDTVQTCFASPFMRILAGVLEEREERRVLEDHRINLACKQWRGQSV